MKKALQTVLFVDDDLNYREIYVENLIKTGFSVSVANDGLEAFDLLCKKTFDILITDYNMPRLDGDQLIERAFMAGFKFKKIILLSNMPGLENKMEGLQKRVGSVIIKNKTMDMHAIVDLLRV